MEGFARGKSVRSSGDPPNVEVDSMSHIGYRGGVGAAILRLPLVSPTSRESTSVASSERSDF
jgi:hypothetical protein